MKVRIKRKLTAGASFSIDVEALDTVHQPNGNKTVAWTLIKLSKSYSSGGGAGSVTPPYIYFNSTINIPVGFSEHEVAAVNKLVKELSAELKDRSLEIIPDETITLNIK